MLSIVGHDQHGGHSDPIAAARHDPDQKVSAPVETTAAERPRRISRAAKRCIANAKSTRLNRDESSSDRHPRSIVLFEYDRPALTPLADVASKNRFVPCPNAALRVRILPERPPLGVAAKSPA